MGAIKVTFKQRNNNINVNCCPNKKNQIHSQRGNYQRKTGKIFKFHCCFCYELKTLNFVEPVNFTIENTKFTCKECFESNSSTILYPNFKGFYPFSTIKLHKSEVKQINVENISQCEPIDEEYVIANEDSDSEKTETNSNEDLKLFEIGEEFMNDRQIERYQNEIEALKIEVESLKSQINRDDEDIEFYRNESCHSWNLRAKLVTEIIDLADELAVNEIKKGKRYRRQSI